MEVLVEFFVEIFLEIFFEIGGVVISKIAIDKRKRKITKYCISFFVFACCLSLIIYSLIVKKMLYVQLAMAYFLGLLVCYILEFINKNMIYSKKLGKVLLYIKRGIHYVFPILVITLVNIYKTDQSVLITCLAVVVLVLYFGVILYRITYRDTYSNFKRRAKKFLKDFQESEDEKYFESLLKLSEKSPSYLLKWIEECTKKEVNPILKFIIFSERYCTQEFYDVLQDIADKYNLNIESELLEFKNKFIEESEPEIY